ncbi:MAG: diacylglycerol kinase [Gammaproteobacteria bacterium RBG_16_57_12]|nr:MAG: diacylglycerol kinase [Gammaproteobacteria bacterium RBG_16_57_12]
MTNGQKPRGLTRLIKAAGYSLAGLKAAWRHEEAFRIEVILFVILAPLALWLGETGLQRALLIGSLMLVLIAELVNSAIETVVDRFGGEQHELSGRAKDIGSAAVFIALGNVVIIWALIITDLCRP